MSREIPQCELEAAIVAINDDFYSDEGIWRDWS